MVTSPVLGEEMRSGKSKGQWALKVRTAIFLCNGSVWAVSPAFLSVIIR